MISGEKAECAHHIRLGTNGGSSLKPSDYFCIPLLNEYHATGLFALHIIGEGTFFELFKLDKNQLFIKYLKQFLDDVYDTDIEIKTDDHEKVIAYMIDLIESLSTKKDRPTKAKNKSITENEFYQKAKEQNRIRDKELRAKLKSESDSPLKSSLKENEYYQKVKELKRIQDKEYRAKMKPAVKRKALSVTESEYYQKAKEQKRIYDKELRAQMKSTSSKSKTGSAQSDYYQKAKEEKRLRDKEYRASITQSDFYQKAKEEKRLRDKEFRAKLKEQQKARKLKKEVESSLSE